MNPLPVKRKHFLIFPVFVGSLVLFMLIGSPLAAFETSMRGNYPACQMNCLSEHNKKVNAVCEAYTKEKNIEYFQNSIEAAVARYVECINQCKMVLPVK